MSIPKPKIIWSRVTGVVEKRPLTSFLIALTGLLGLIVLSNFIFNPKGEKNLPPPVVKEVKVYRLDTTPKIIFQAQVNKSGVIKIFSQTAAIVQAINIREGQNLNKGANLITLASSYAGGNPAAVQAGIAARQYQFSQETYQTQKDLIEKQREVANQTQANTTQLRDISSQSLTETNSLVDLNQQIIDSLNQNLKNLIGNNLNGANDALILQTRQLLSQSQAGQNQLKNQQRQLTYQTDTGQPPAALTDLQQEIALKQLDIQEKSLDLNKDLARLQVNLANLNAALYHPVAPFAAQVDRVYVKVGQSVNPGTPLVALNSPSHLVNAVALLPEAAAREVSRLEPSRLFYQSAGYELYPNYVSQEATDGQLYAVTYQLPPELAEKLVNESYVEIEIPFRPAEGNRLYLPLDAVFQTQEAALVYVVKDDRAESRPVKLGEVAGGFVEVIEGVGTGDRIILNRNVIQGDQVKVTNE